MMGIAKTLVKTLGAIFVGAVVYIGFNVAQVYLVGRSDEARPVDAIVVLGAAQYDGRPSPQLQARLDHALLLWRQGVAPLVVVTGGKQPADRFTEAEASAKYLVSGGVPLDSIALENTGRTTRESLLGVREIIRARNLNSLLLVTDPYHAQRAALIAQDIGLRVFVSPTRTSTIRGGENLSRHLREGAGVALGQIIGFRSLERLTH